MKRVFGKFAPLTWGQQANQRLAQLDEARTEPLHLQTVDIEALIEQTLLKCASRLE